MHLGTRWLLAALIAGSACASGVESEEQAQQEITKQTLQAVRQRTVRVQLPQGRFDQSAPKFEDVPIVDMQHTADSTYGLTKQAGETNLKGTFSANAMREVAVARVTYGNGGAQ